MTDSVEIIECPRDAMQGIKEFIPTKNKVAYINSLLSVGFDTIDVGSFVSPRLIPQMRDTAEVLKSINYSNKNSDLLTIVANYRGAEDACAFDEVDFLGFPFSISETFQKRNTNSTIEESLIRVEKIRNLCEKKGKTLQVYISMGFGNPYGEAWNAEIAIQWVKKLVEMDINTIALSDTIGVSNPENISYIFSSLIPEFPDVVFGAHLHTHVHNWKEKVEAAYKNGCKRFDGALKGFGGCPMAEDELVGNMPTENLVAYFTENGVKTGLDMDKFFEASEMALKTFPPV